ncbi:LAGLIDADG family homing endonuclease [Patescibacteria group bacterium]
MDRRTYEYLLGVYLGDGTPYNKYGIKITTAEDGYRDVLMKLMQSLEPRLGRGKETCHRIYAGLAKNPCDHMFVPFKKNFYWLHLPKLKHPEEFVAGVFDTDGSIRKRKWTKKDTYEIMIYQKRRENLIKIAKIMEPLLIYPALRRVGTKDKVMFYLDITHPTQMKIFAKQIPSRHPRKKTILRECENYGPYYAAKHRDCQTG